MKKKYKILFLNSIRENVWAGGENLFYNYATHLSRRGHKIWVAGRKNSEFLGYFSSKEINLVPLKIRGDFDPINIFSLVQLMLREKINSEAISSRNNSCYVHRKDLRNFPKSVVLPSSFFFSWNKEIIWRVRIQPFPLSINKLISLKPVVFFFSQSPNL